MATSIDIDPAFGLFTLILTYRFLLFICVLFPYSKRLSFKDAATSLTQNFFQSSRDLLQIFCLAFYVLKCCNCSSQVRNINMIKMLFDFVQMYSYLLGLLFSIFSQSAWLLAANYSL